MHPAWFDIVQSCSYTLQLSRPIAAKLEEEYTWAFTEGEVGTYASLCVTQDGRLKHFPQYKHNLYYTGSLRESVESRFHPMTLRMNVCITCIIIIIYYFFVL